MFHQTLTPTVRRAGVVLFVLALSAASFGCRGRRDLTDALDGGIGRQVSQPLVASESYAWAYATRSETTGDFASGAAICWLGDSLVVGGGRRLDLYDADGHIARSLLDTADGRALRAISQVRCAPTRRRVLVADDDKRTLHFFDLDSAASWQRSAPPIPQEVPYIGELALADGNLWFDAWLGARVGPFLDGATWDSVPLVRIWRGADTHPVSAGRTTAYRLPATRRVFNHVSLAVWKDTVWVLTQANAAITGFTADGAGASKTIFLPVYHRGMEPWIEVGAPLPNGFRRNRVIYNPNVGGLAIANETTFAVLRFRSWERVERTTSNGTFQDVWPSSFVELVDRNGVPRRSLGVPGRARAVAANGRGLVAVLTEELDGRRRVLVGRLPAHRESLIAAHAPSKASTPSREGAGR